MAKTSSAVKRRYNNKTYKSYTVSIRKDSELYECLEQYISDGNTFSGLTKDLLENFFIKSV